MSQTLEQLGITEMSSTERLELIGLLWDSLSDADPAPTPDWHLHELAKRRSAADADPAAGIPWETVKARLNGSR